MALVRTEDITVPTQGFSRLSIYRQIGLLVGLAASIALGASVLLWSGSEDYQPLFGSLSHKEMGEVIQALQSSNIQHRIDQATGTISVPVAEVHNARIKLAADGLPSSTAQGFELMNAQQGFGTSRFMEAARYQRAIEGELARTISSLRNVKTARVHLAIPKQSVFVRNRRSPSASVVITQYGGRPVSDEQLAGITHLVASSVPSLSSEQVTIIDQNGRLLTNAGGAATTGLDSRQFDYTRRLESALVKHIEDILTPIVGLGNVKAQVVADLDYTVTEKTQESFDPDKRVTRSEQTAEDQQVGGANVIGVPGALSNQPPGAAAAPEQVPTPESDDQSQKSAQQPTVPSSKSKRSTQNYEVDKTISHTRLAVGAIKRLSVAVVIDELRDSGPNGEDTRVPLSPEEKSRYIGLVKKAVGFEETRGDTITLVTAPFSKPSAVEEIPELPIWEQPWFWSTVKQGLAGLVVLMLIFGVLRPAFRNLTSREMDARQAEVRGGEADGEDQELLAPPNPKVQQLEATKEKYD